ncbi:MAG TPA: ABC transporter substrate-binding protein [Chloroflexota bacterium]|nr:ABC transporter substrate-binding protein [Chloroflexota bacterium]
MKAKDIFRVFSILLVLALFIAACGSQQETTATPTAATTTTTEETAEETAEEPAETAETTEEMPEVAFDYPPGGYLERAIQGEFTGTTVTVDGAFEGNDVDGVKFSESMKAFEEATGIKVNYIGNKEFEGSIAIRVGAGDAPDIVDFPQPGLFANFVRSGDVIPVTEFISDEWLSQQYNDGWREFNTVDGQEMGVMHRFSGKSLVWYPKAAWDAAGYEIPETWEELMALTAEIAADGDTAWCIGIESGAATGWVATDWTEEMMLRTTSLENYDAWVAGTLPFDSPEVKNAIETWSELWFNDDYVLGGRSSIVSTFFGDSPGPMFADPPQCWLHKQANFITSFFPQGTEYGVDYDFFYLPPVDEAYGRPFLVAGDLMAMFNDRPEVRALMEYFTTPQSVSGWMEGGGAIAAQKTATQDMYGSDLDWGVSELVNQATSFRFDGSDLMPGEVGAGSFWEQISSYVAGSIDLATAMQAIDATWPAGVSGSASITEGAPDTGLAYPPGGFLERAINGEFTGTTVTVDGAFEGNDVDGVKFSESVKAFEEATGIKVNYIGNKEFEGSIAIRVGAGDAPDIVDFPQPGLFANFVRSGDVIPVTEFISDEWLSQQYNDGWREFNTVDGQEMGVMHRFSGKSLVWYPKAAWDAAGYEIPETWEELMALTAEIAADGDTAWCIGIESGAATGWVATDWTEEMMLRTTSLENYDAWVAGTLPFDSPEVKNAIETWSELWFNDDYVLGGRSSIVSTFFGDSPGPMFADPPQCWLHKQANFITSFFPQGTEYGVDYDFFYLPPVDEAYGRPFLVAGDLMAMFNDRPEVRALMEYFTTPQSVSGWMEGGGAIAAQKTATQDMYGSDLDWGVSELVNQATSFRFDGSDLMPGEVGAGSFWEQISSYVAGSIDLATAMQAIDASWPR